MSSIMSDSEKEEFLKKAKQEAVEGIEKTASFNGRATASVYPSPFLNLSDMQLPNSMIEIFKWCKYYYTFDPLISGAINALATFPITEISLEDNDGSNNSRSCDIKLYEKVLFKNLNIYKLLIEIGIDYFLYGNCFIMGEMRGKDGEQEWVTMTRLDPSRIIVEYNASTGKKMYKWRVPDNIRRIVQAGKPVDEFNKIPEIIKSAVRKNKAVVLHPSAVYHFSRATDSMGNNSVWGVPLVANVLKLLMYRNVLRQAQEAIAREHIVPMRIFYIDRTKEVNTNGNWNYTADAFAKELQKNVIDPNHKVVSPVPVNCINVGGEGRSLLLQPEIEQVQSEILAGMNVPREFIFGGVSYSGSSISIRILENNFITYRLLLKDFIQNFIIRRMAVARHECCATDYDTNILTVKLADLKMQDDVQQKQLFIQLNSNGKISDDYLWKSFGIDSAKMKKAIQEEAKEAVRNKAELELTQLEMQKKIMEKQLELAILQSELDMKKDQIQRQMVQKMTPNNTVVNDDNMNSSIDALAAKLSGADEETRNAVVSKLPGEVRVVLAQRIGDMKAQQQKEIINNAKEQNKSDDGEVDMRPLPEQKPPRRNSMK